MVTGEGPFPVLISTHDLLTIFSLPCPVEEGSDGAALASTWHLAKVKPQKLFIIS